MQNVLTSKGFVEETKSNEALVWGVDPNVTDIFAVVIFVSSSLKEIIRKTFTKGYYHMFRFNLAAQGCMQHQ